MALRLRSGQAFGHIVRRLQLGGFSRCGSCVESARNLELPAVTTRMNACPDTNLTGDESWHQETFHAKRFVSGYGFSHIVRRLQLGGFSRCGSCVESARNLELPALTARMNACPDTNRPGNDTKKRPIQNGSYQDMASAISLTTANDAASAAEIIAPERRGIWNVSRNGTHECVP